MITSLPEFNKITDLICSYNKLEKLGQYKNIQYLEFIGDSLKRLEYYPTLNEICYDKGQNIEISSKYKIKSKRLHKNKFIVIEFNVDKDMSS
jgi:hypothetical protein